MTHPPANPPRWTDAQHAAITHVAGDLLVSAAAGSGKTAVLAERCARLVTHDNPTHRTPVDRLLVLTFTDAAATEMRTRIADAIRNKVPSIQNPGDHRSLLQQLALVERASIGTIDSFCARILRTYFHEANIDPAFDVMDAQEASLLKEEVIDDVLAHRHARQDPAFEDFWEAYAQGQDSALKSIVLNLDTMLSVVAEPENWIARAQHHFTPDGALSVLQHLATDVAADMQRAAEFMQRSIADLAQLTGLEEMRSRIAGCRDTLLQWSATLVSQKDAAWDTAANALRQFEWGTLKTNKAVINFKELKDLHYEKCKDAMGKIQSHFPPLLTRARLLSDMLSLAAPFVTLTSIAADFRTAFTAAKQAQNRLDFNDIKRLAYNLLKNPASHAALDLQHRYDHVMVDEVQDINPLDAAIIDRVRNAFLHHARGNLFVVGDIKQSIYGFRHADPSIFSAKETTLKQRTDYPAVVYLQHNFRSHPALLAALNAIFHRVLTPQIAGVDYAAGHALTPPPTPAPVATPTAFPGSPMELHVVLTNQDDTDKKNDEEDDTSNDIPPTAAEREATAVADRIATLMNESRTVVTKDGPRPLRYRDIAILLRSAKTLAPAFTRALASRGIPVHADLAVGFFDAQEIRDTLALLAVIDNPLQDIPLATALLSPFGRFSHDDLATIRLAFDRKTTPFADAALAYPTAFNDDLATRLQQFFAQIDHFRQLMRTLALHEALAEIYRLTGILTWVAALPAGTQRVANLQMLHHRALEFASFRRQGLYRFLTFIERLQNSEEDFGEAPTLSDAADVVRIMTIHKSKGLEFPVVVVAGLGKKFNEEHGGAVQIDRTLGLGLLAADVPAERYYPTAITRRIAFARKKNTRAEELRLLYVALTRAREHLILFGTAGKLETVEAKRSLKLPVPHPEDLLLRAHNMLDWLLPVAGNESAHLTFIPHHPTTESSDPPAETQTNTLLEKIRHQQPLDATPPTPRLAVTDMITRITAPYAHAPLTTIPALLSVTELKRRATLHPDPENPAAEISKHDPRRTIHDPRTLPHPAWLTPTQSSVLSPQSSPPPTAADRGTATHKLLELLDLPAIHTKKDLLTQREYLLSRSLLTTPEADMISLDDIAWFLLDSPTGQALRTALNDTDAPLFAASTTPTLYRELGFSFKLPPNEIQSPKSQIHNSQLSSLDLPQLRGVIDVLLLTPAHAHILDYKTDAPTQLTPDRLAGYRLQMHLYARAAENILGRKIDRATLIFLSAHREEVIENPAAPAVASALQ